MDRRDHEDHQTGERGRREGRKARPGEGRGTLVSLEMDGGKAQPWKEKLKEKVRATRPDEKMGLTGRKMVRKTEVWP